MIFRKVENEKDMTTLLSSMPNRVFEVTEPVIVDVKPKGKI
jgi:hypothetical protein